MVTIVNPDVVAEVNADGQYISAAATRKQFVSLKNVRIAEVVNGIKNGIPAVKHVLAIYGRYLSPMLTAVSQRT